MRIDVAISFLKRFHPATPWALACFGPGPNEVGPARTFDPSEEQAARGFLRRVQGEHNVYFTVNCVSGRPTKKVKKRDIAEIHWLHLDADLPKTIDWSDDAAVDAEKARVLEKLRTNNPPPTAIIWSGGGYQAFWRLSEIIQVERDPARIQLIEDRMKVIEKEFGADGCNNVDRVMRLPGTLNVLDATKTGRGRKPAFAEMVEFHDDRIYDLEEFPLPVERAPPPRSNGEAHYRTGEDDRDELERARDALRSIPSDDYDVYLRVCMAMKSAFGDVGFGACRDWAMSSIKFDDGEIRRKWNSISPDGGITVRTLFAMARDYGWRGERPGDRSFRQGAGSDETNHRDPSPSHNGSIDWPIIGSAASYGLIGEIARLATRESEADPIAVMGTALAWGGASFGRSRFYRVGDTLHHARLFCALVGASSRARKGTSVGPVQRIFREAETILRYRSTLPFARLPLNVAHGLSSGEGLVAAIRDKRTDDDDGAVEDKRLLVVEGEFGAVLRHFQRQGNTLSTTLRTAWDGSDLGTMTKHDRDSATAPHICIVGHITNQELNALLGNTDIWNGMANRFQWLAVRRGKPMPFARAMPDAEVTNLARELAHIIEFSHTRSHGDAEFTMSNSARDHWVACYPELTEDHAGILGAVTSRAEAQALRLAMHYAQFDGAQRIELHHLEAGLTFWRYAFDSAAHIFKGTEIDPVAQRIVEALAMGPKTQTELHNLFGRNLTEERLNGVLRELQGRGRIAQAEEQTGGRPRKVWRLLA